MANTPLNAVDPTRELILVIIGVMTIGGLIGGAVSGAADAGIQYATTGEVDLGQVAISAGTGFFTGAVTSSPLGGLGVLVGVGTTAAVGAYAQEAYQDVKSGNEIDYVGNIAPSVLTGGLAMVTSGIVGRATTLNTPVGKFSFANGSTHNLYIVGNAQYVSGVLANNSYAIYATSNAITRSSWTEAGKSIGEEAINRAIDAIGKPLFAALKCDESGTNKSEGTAFKSTNRVVVQTPSAPVPSTRNEKAEIAKATAKESAVPKATPKKGENKAKTATTSNKPTASSKSLTSSAPQTTASLSKASNPTATKSKGKTSTSKAKR